MTTLNLQVGASADDGRSTSAPGFDSSNANSTVGKNIISHIFESWHRFTGVSGLSGVTIDAADFQLDEKSSTGTPLTNVYADDSAAPTAPTTRGEHTGKTRTTNFVAWDGDPGADGFHGLEIKTVIQELADDFDPSEIQILHDDDGTGSNVFRESSSYDEGSSVAAKLDITYTPPAPGTLVESAVDSQLESVQGHWGPYWSDESIAVIIFSDDGEDLSFVRTTDKGATWATTQVEVGSVEEIAAWWDKETPGDTGTLVHVAWKDNVAQDWYYITIDVSDASQGTKRTVDATVDSFLGFSNHSSISKAVNGNLMIVFSTGTEIECYRSDDDGVTWDTRADVYETANEEDWVLLFPADVDAGDFAAVFWDRSADEITIKMYDESANTWTEFGTPVIATANAVDSIAYRNMDGAVRHSDNHVLFAVHSNHDDAGDDLLTFDLTVDSITVPSITAKANIFTNQGESAQVAMFINQQNDDIYVAYLKGGTWEAAVDVVFHISTDGMASWGTEQAYSGTTGTHDFTLVHAGRSMGNAGGRYQPGFYEDHEIDIWINEVNDIEFAAVVAAGGIPAKRTSKYMQHLLTR